MKLLVGLGNPGARYAGSRHNIGFRIALEFARAHDIAIDGERFHGLYGVGSLAQRVAPEVPACPDPDPVVGLLLPATFMNASGRAVEAALAALPEIDAERDLLVAYDDLDLPLGRIRLRPAGGDGGHNGMASIIDALGTERFARLRFGIGRPEPGSGQRVIDFVLERFTPQQQADLAGRVARACDAVELVFRAGAAAAMDRFNGPMADAEPTPGH